MARTDVTTEQVIRDGLVPSMTAPTADGDIIDAGRVALFVENTGSASHDVTVLTPLMVDGLDVEQLVVSVAAGEQRLIGPFPDRTFAQPESASVGAGRVLVDYDTPADWLRTVVSI